MSQYHGSSFSGTTSGYIKFCEKEKALAFMFYNNQNKKDERENALKKYIEENKLKISFKQIENEFKRYAMEHDKEMEEIATKKEIELEKLKYKREADKERHEKEMEKIKLDHDLASKSLDIKKEEIAKEEERKTKHMLLEDERKKIEIAKEHEREIKKISDTFTLKSNYESHRHGEELERIRIEGEKARGEIDVKIKGLELESQRSEQQHKQTMESMKYQYELSKKNAEDAMEKAKLESDEKKDIRDKEHDKTMTDIKSSHQKDMTEIQYKHDLEKMIKEKESKEMDQNFQIKMKQLEIQEKFMTGQFQMGMCNQMNPMMGNNMMMPMMQNQYFQGFQGMANPKQQDMSPAPYNSQEPTKEPNNNSVNKPEGMSQSQMSGNCVTPMMNNNYGMNMMQGYCVNPMMQGNYANPMMNSMMMGNCGMPMGMGNCGMNMMMQGNLGMSMMNGTVDKV